MLNSKKYTGKLDFLNEFIQQKNDKDDKYNLFYFFKSKFEDNSWLFEFNSGKPYLINFNVELKDKSSLTDKQNALILNTLKEWIINYLYIDKHYMNTPKTIKGDVSLILRFFDIMNYFDDGVLVKNSFKCLSKDKLNFILDKLSSTDDIFDIESKVNAYINNNNLNKNAVFNRRAKNSDIMNNVFPNLIIKPTFKNLELKNDNSYYITEFDSFFRNSNKQEKVTIHTNIRKILNYIPYESTRECSFPFKENIDFIQNTNFITSGIKRFETYPSNVIFNTFKNAVEFHLKYGDLLVNNYLTIIDLKNKDKNLSHTELNKTIIKYLDKDLINLGVKAFQKEYKTIKSSNNYYQNIRKNHYFYELIKVYYGCIQFVVGALMGRRISELRGLKYNDCYDEENQLLLFQRSKSTKGLFGIKDYIALPIDKLAIDMLKNLQRIINACDIEDKEHIEIFSIPSGVQINTISSELYDDKYNGNLDIMHDYFEVDVIDNKRLYIRQHQLRRFFAMTFFWSSGFGSLDTLRWFLGHTDIEHVYHYISETESGDVLRSVKAQFVAENIKEYYEDLREFIKHKFNTDNYKVLKTDELIELLEILQEEKTINIEPEFFESDNQQKFKVIIKIKGE